MKRLSRDYEKTTKGLWRDYELRNTKNLGKDCGFHSIEQLNIRVQFESLNLKIWMQTVSRISRVIAGAQRPGEAFESLKLRQCVWWKNSVTCNAASVEVAVEIQTIE